MPCNPFQDMIKYKLREIERLHDIGCGVYGFWYTNTCIYVGKAEQQTIFERLLQHYYNTHNERLRLWMQAKGSQLQIAFKVIEKQSRIHLMERYCVEKYQPTANLIRFKGVVRMIPGECM
jgi:hypothetical protein